jgi:nucleoside diphosphate kinase
VNEVDNFFVLIDKNSSQTIDFGEFLYFMLEFHHVKFKISAEKELFLRQHRILTNSLIKDPVLCGKLSAFCKPTSNQMPGQFQKIDSFMILEAIYEQEEDNDNKEKNDAKEVLEIKTSLQPKQVSCSKTQEYTKKENLHGNSIAPQPILPAATNTNIVHPYRRISLVAPMDLNVENAFIFIKPHANNKLVQKYVREFFNINGVLIKAEGMINTSDLDHKHLAERQYREIGQNAITKPLVLSLKPMSLNLFHETFGCTWEEALWKDLVFNCIDACEKLGITVSELRDAWLKATLCTELRSSLHCAYIDCIKGKPAIYVINGFYPSMIAEYLQESASIYYMSLEWTRDDKGENRVITYSDFNRLIGSPNPVDADVGSIRSGLFTHWQELGLSRVPNIIENCIQSSKSAFEAFIGRTLWLSSSIDDDPMGIDMMRRIPRQTVKYWSTNPIYGDFSQMRHLSHSLVGLGREECIQEAIKLYSIKNILHDESNDGYGKFPKITQL